MKVGDLIEILKTMPSQAEVVTPQYACGRSHYPSVEPNQVIYNSDHHRVELGEEIN